MSPPPPRRQNASSNGSNERNGLRRETEKQGLLLNVSNARVLKKNSPLNRGARAVAGLRASKSTTFQAAIHTKTRATATTRAM